MPGACARRYADCHAATAIVSDSPVVEVDVAVVGAGPAGLSAARESALGGARTLLLDSSSRPGGQYYRQPGFPGLSATPIQDEGHALIGHCVDAGAEIRPGVSVWTARSADGCIELDTVSTDGRRAKIRAQSAIVAVGAHERFVPIPGWTLPGVFSAGGIQTFLKEQGVPIGTRTVLGGTGPLQLVAAAQLVSSGVNVPGVLELARPGSYALRHPLPALTGAWGQWDRLKEGAHAAVTLARNRTRLRRGWAITDILGSDRVEGVRAAPIGAEHRPIENRAIEIACDAVALHHGLVPNVELLRLLGAELEPGVDPGGLVPRRGPNLETTADAVFAAGDGTGVAGVGLSLVEGTLAGQAAAAKVQGRTFHPPRRLATRLGRERRFERLYAALFRVPDALFTALGTPATTACRCEEVTVAQLDAAIAAGACTSWMVKSVTRAGMGPCQGRVCMPAVEARLRAKGLSPDALSRSARPPLAPLPIKALAEGPDADS